MTTPNTMSPKTSEKDTTTTGEHPRGRALKLWGNRPARNPRYNGATPNQIVRAMLRKRTDKTRRFKTGV